MSSVEQLTATATTIAEKLGIEKFDIYGSSVDENSVQVDHGNPKQVKASNRSGVTVRVWNQDQHIGVTSTTDIDPLGLELALQSAYEASFFGTREHVPDFSPEATAPLPELPDQSAPQVGIDTLIQELISVEQQLLQAHPAIQDVPYNGLSQRHVKRFYLNSAGAHRQEARSSSSVYLYTKTTEPGRKPRSAGAFRVGRSLANLDIQGCLHEAAEKTISHLNYQKIKSGKYTVIFSPEAFLSLLNAFSNLFNAQNILDKQSLSTPDDLGKPMASPRLSVYDDALHPENIAAIAFDDEGTPTRRVPLIEQGILKGFLHSAGTAKRLETQPTGHANIGAKVTVSPHFYHVLPGTVPSTAYTLEAAENVILIDDLQALHAGVKSLQGSFSLPFAGWLINGGQRTSIESATVAGDFLELLQAIAFVDLEPELTPSGICPRIWVENLAITGE